MFRILLLAALTHFVFACKAQPDHIKKKKNTDFKELLVAIREVRVSEADAKEKFKEIYKFYKEKYPSTSLDSANYEMVFPLKGKNYKSVGGRGKGFYARLFNLFDHSISASHPAHDIFIYDLNRDCVDDGDQEYIDILAVNDGIVIATETDWKEGDPFKGGNYVWLYDFSSGGLWYFAHMRKTFVVKNQLVQAGDKLGEVGRSGFNAENKRSDTHLHLMFLNVDPEGNPRPVNHYSWLKKARTVYQTQLPSHFPRKDFKVSHKLKPLGLGSLRQVGTITSKDLMPKSK